ncbi:MAG: cysteinyl-tRNA synthetase [Actinomycetota bacterium]
MCPGYARYPSTLSRCCRGWASQGQWTYLINRRLVRVLNLYDTATQSVKTLALREPGKVGIYLCGPTVYGPPHLGHGRARWCTTFCAATSPGRAWKSGSCRTSPISTTRSSTAPIVKIVRGKTSPTSAKTCGLKQWASWAYCVLMSEMCIRDR